TPFHIGILAAIPAFLTGLGFLSAYMINRLTYRKTLTIITSGIARMLFIIPVIFLLLKSKISLVFFLVLIGIFNALLVIADNAWLSWMSDLVPQDIRGRFFGIRNTAMGLIGMIVAMSGARLLDYFKIRNRPDLGFILIFSIASLFALIGLVFLTKQPEVANVRKKVSFKTIFWAPLKNKNFRNFLKFIAFWNLTSGIASPFYIVFMLNHLKMLYSRVAIYSIIAGIMTLIFGPLWGRAIDRFRSKPVLYINFIAIGFLPFLWIFPKENFLFPVWLDAFLTGIFWPAVNLGVFNIVLSLSENEELKESYFAIYSTITGLSGFISSLIGGYLANLTKSLSVTVIGLHLVNYQFFFIFAGITLFLSLLFLKQVSETKEISPSYVLGIMTDYALRRLNYGRDFILNTIRFFRGK
ncbi:MAG: MFS transporter, partial [candidate division WOR-3 bacterium]|nr:MFS transporter [candidate division WOR-3 bacterium]